MINILDKTTIDKIAAGEVVERPASIVKELLENAIDAKASQITVEIKQGGVDFIRITDNGVGIAAEEVKTAFLRHATSKIAKDTDLLHLQTLGFRGEALSSIAAVSRVEFITKTRDGFTGVRYCIEGGIEKSYEEIGAPDGTTIICRDLFFNTPARRKFLKSPNTEAAYIYEYIEKLALSHANIAFRFIKNNQTRLQTYGNENIKDIVYSIYGKEVANALIPVNYEKNGIQIQGFIAKPEISKGNRSHESFFVNQRFIRDKSISLAIEEGYKDRLMQHQYPFTILQFQIDSDVVDVNVHPAKMQVRFSDPAQIYEATREAVDEALTGRELIRSVGFGQELKREDKLKKYVPILQNTKLESKSDMDSEAQRSLSNVAKLENSENPSSAVKTESFKGQYSVDRSKNSEAQPSAVKTETSEDALRDVRLKGFTASRGGMQVEEKSETMNRPPEIFEAARNLEYLEKMQMEQNARILKSEEEMQKYEQLHFFEPKHRSDFRIVGQIFDTYWIIEFSQKMYIIDQHAAHEKVLYERFVSLFEKQKVPSQMMSPAAVLSVSERERVSIEENIEIIRKMGFEIEDFGGKEIKISAVPSLLPSVEKIEVLKELIAQLSDYESMKTPNLILAKLASLSCKAAVKGNAKLSLSQVNTLLDELFETKNPYTCPHGRPTIIEMSKAELEKKFKRIL